MKKLKNGTPEHILDIISDNKKFQERVDYFVGRGAGVEGAYYRVLREVRIWYPKYNPYKSYGSFLAVINRRVRYKLRNNVRGGEDD